MTGIAQRRTKSGSRLFDGRVEKRLAMAVPVYLTSMKEPHARERTTTENVSPHGAHVISNRFWQSGEEALIAPLAGGFPQVGRVVYCEVRAGGTFRVGIEFPDRAVRWADYRM